MFQNLVPRNHAEQNGTHLGAPTEEQRQKMAAEDDDDDDPESLISKLFLSYHRTLKKASLFYTSFSVSLFLL